MDRWGLVFNSPLYSHDVFKGYLIGSAVVVTDINEARKLYSMGFYGKFVNEDKVKLSEVNNVNSPLQLSIIEALYLVDKGFLEVFDCNGNKLTRDDLVKVGHNTVTNFDQVYTIYRELRDGGFVVKSGLKFGSLFAVYERGPGIDHAPVLLHFIEPRRAVSALDITRAARLSHSVNKRFVLATQSEVDGKMHYVAFEWWRA
ncbi:MAG: tRNA-intron lyase [Vulcanisaeta sp.]|jgi:tRNA-intron endonuclease|uniref:tRNA-intron lyase n=1 Tax=Vulcanisaeta sp. TaxID=2020871 RepID=UPI003D10E10C